MNKLEKKICKTYKKENTYFTGNGTTALYLIFKALNKQNKKILFPNITCMTPVNAALYAGYDVEFCDVNRENFTIDTNKLKEVIKKNNIGIVVPTHIYGHICDMKSIYEFCKKKGVTVIEDAAQTVTISEYNDFAITSFGHTKLLETELGGGAIFFKSNNSLKESFDLYARALKSESNSLDFSKYTKKYYEITKTLSGEKYYSEMKKLQLNSQDIFLRHFKENNELLSKLDKKEKVISDRNIRRDLYFKDLNKSVFKFPNIKDETMWRLSLLTKNINRNNLVNKLREKNIDVSTWYPCLHRFYTDLNDNNFKNSIYVSDNIVNFWVTEKYSVEKIKFDIENINKEINILKGDYYD